MATSEYNQTETAASKPQTAPPNGAPQNGSRNGDGAAPTPQNGNGAGAPPPAAPADDTAKRNNRPLLLVVGVIVAIIAVIWGIKYYHYSTTHASTDDAYVSGDLINVSPIISGTLIQLNVDEGDHVKAGTIVARLDDSGPKAAYQQAEAQEEAAESQLPQAETNLLYTQQTTADQIAQAQAGLAAQNAKVAQEANRTDLTRETVQSQLAQSQAQAQAAKQQVQTARAQMVSAETAVKTASAAVAAAHQRTIAAEATAVQKHRDAVRYASLYGSNGNVGAVTGQQYDAALAADQTAQAQLEEARENEQQAIDTVAQNQSMVAAAEASVNGYQSQALAAISATGVAQAGLYQIPVQQGNVTSADQTARQNFAELSTAQAGQSQVTLRKQMIDTLKAQVTEAIAVTQQAKVTLDDTVIYAPSDGTVVKKGANVGDALSPGQTIFTMTQGNSVWVTANYKETQVQHMKAGQSAEVDVDAFPGTTFIGKVQSIYAASGNATALLPADNATGNFTKVVQRIPVKILLVPQDKNSDHKATQEDIDRLSQGMSVTAAVDTE